MDPLAYGWYQLQMVIEVYDQPAPNLSAGAR